ncbi:MAG: hypothetical protein JOZ19_13940 [Rubrobacter sp.]|nr:hypothetical protein [Rubrobacter sp.]
MVHDEKNRVEPRRGCLELSLQQLATFTFLAGLIVVAEAIYNHSTLELIDLRPVFAATVLVA